MEDPDQKPQKKTLLQKYEIPIEFLDFPYIKTCDDVKMLEKIVKILRSGEEGFYPDLTKCAEEKLKLLKPDSKVLRQELPAIRKEFLDEEKRNEIENDMKSWISDMKTKDKMVKEIKPTAKPEPPIRKSKVSSEKPKVNPPKPDERIKSTDYSKWDKFDAEAAELKIELDEERQREIVAMKNKKNSEKGKLIEEIEDVEVDCLTEFEKDHLSLKFKEKGNECFKAKEYDEAIEEYTQSLRVKKNAAAFNNRALVYLKLKNFIRTISDANECLKMEPGNIKALVRKGQAFIGQKMLSEAYDTFEKVLDIDGTNQIAHQEMFELRKKLPPKNAFRMKIEEVEDYEEVGSLEPVKFTEAQENLEGLKALQASKLNDESNDLEVHKASEDQKSSEIGKTQMINKAQDADKAQKAQEILGKRVVTKSQKLDLPDTTHIPKIAKNIVVEEPTPFDKLTPKAKEKPRDTLVMPSDIQTKKKNVLIQEIN